MFEKAGAGGNGSRVLTVGKKKSAEEKSTKEKPAEKPAEDEENEESGDEVKARAKRGRRVFDSDDDDDEFEEKVRGSLLMES